MQVQRRIRILEDRLQQASVRYNDALTRSRALRARIDGLRRERLLFEELHGKLQRGLARKKAEIVDVISNIAESHEAREKVGGVGGALTDI
jgi:chromosome segregation ATPase